MNHVTYEQEDIVEDMQPSRNPRWLYVAFLSRGDWYSLVKDINMYGLVIF